MGQLVSTNGDYTIRTGIGSTVTIDTGPPAQMLLARATLRVVTKATPRVERSKEKESQE